MINPIWASGLRCGLYTMLGAVLVDQSHYRNVWAWLYFAAALSYTIWLGVTSK